MYEESTRGARRTLKCNLCSLIVFVPSCQYQANTKQIPRKYQANSERKTKEVGVEFDHFGIIFGDFWGPGSFPRASSKENGFHYDFWSLSRAPSGRSWGPCCDKVGLMKFVFFRVLYHPKSISFSKVVFRAFGTLFGPNWGPFLKIFRSQNRGQRRPRQRCQNCVFASARIKFSMFGIGRHPKGIEHRCQNHSPSMLPRASQNPAQNFPRWPQDGG